VPVITHTALVPPLLSGNAIPRRRLYKLLFLPRLWFPVLRIFPRHRMLRVPSRRRKSASLRLGEILAREEGKREQKFSSSGRGKFARTFRRNENPAFFARVILSLFLSLYIFFSDGSNGGQTQACLFPPPPNLISPPEWAHMDARGEDFSRVIGRLAFCNSPSLYHKRRDA